MLVFNNLSFCSSSVRHLEREVGPGRGAGFDRGKNRITLYFVESPDFFFMGLQIFPCLIDVNL